jgi:hypothetical protein
MGGSHIKTRGFYCGEVKIKQVDEFINHKLMMVTRKHYNGNIFLCHGACHSPMVPT